MRSQRRTHHESRGRDFKEAWNWVVVFYDAVRATVSMGPVLRQDKGLDLTNADRVSPKSTATEVKVMRFWPAIERLHADLAADDLCS